jgi:hypothetical protein
MRITIVLVKLDFFGMSGFKMEQSAVIEFCIKLKKTATEMFEMWKSSYAKNVYRDKVCLNGIKGSKKGSETENAKITDANNFDCIL